MTAKNLMIFFTNFTLLALKLGVEKKVAKVFKICHAVGA